MRTTTFARGLLTSLVTASLISCQRDTSDDLPGNPPAAPGAAGASGGAPPSAPTEPTAPPAAPGAPPSEPSPPAAQIFPRLRAPAGNRPTARNVNIDGYNAAILPNGRLLTPVGLELNVDAPKPFGMAVTHDGNTAATINSGASRFSVTLVRNITGTSAEVKRIPVNATFMGIVFSPAGDRFYASGGENGNIWVGDVQSASIIGSVNLNGVAHPLPSPSAANPFPDPARTIISSFRGSFPGAMALTTTGKYLYVVDQGNFSVHVIDTAKIATGVDAEKKIVDMNNFAAVVHNVRVGRYPFGISLAPDDRKLYVANVGVFQYSHLIPRGPDATPGGTLPPNLTGDKNLDYPLCFPGNAYPDDVEADKVIKIKKIDARMMATVPPLLRDPEGIRCGYVDGDRDFKVPGLGSPNAEESSSVYVLDLAAPAAPTVEKKVKTGLLVGEVEHGIATHGGAHPNSVAVGHRAVFVANGNNDSISILDPKTQAVVRTVSLAPLTGIETRLRGVQPVSLALSPDQRWLYVAEAGINAVGVMKVEGQNARLMGHIPTGWWPASVKLSADGRRLFVSSAKGRGAPPNLIGETADQNAHPKHSVMGTLQVLDVPVNEQLLARHTERVMKNNGFLPVDELARPADPSGLPHPIPTQPGVASGQIKHVVFIAKENLTHDLVLGDILRTRRGQMVNGDPRLALPADASPNHHELALQFAFSDNFYLEPTVSSDGHRWLTNSPTTEFEETHWPASYGSKRVDAGTNLEIIDNWPGRLGFTDANSSTEPQDYMQHGGLFLHLHRNGQSFINFGEGYEFAIVDEDAGTEPTGIRNKVNVPMEKVLRDNTDHLFPQYNTTIPDAPLPENPDRFSRFGRLQQVWKDQLVKDGECKLPAFTYILYPNDHGGGANDINGPAGPAWDFKRYVQDNDAALGLTVELISKSPCWKDTVIFVTEDDTQSGVDHVDGYRTVFLAISPWVKREYVSKTHTSLASVFKTINLIFGAPALNLYDAAATDLSDMFTAVPNLSPYHYQAPALARVAKASWKRLTRGVDFTAMDSEEINMRTAIMQSEGIPRKRPVVFDPRPAAARPLATR
jgi:YVTN family beta-propeller protein